MTEEIRAIVNEHARLYLNVSTLGDDEDLYSAGLTSHASVRLMLALESQFDLEFPERMLQRKSFESIAAISAVISELLEEQVA